MFREGREIAVLMQERVIVLDTVCGDDCVDDFAYCHAISPQFAEVCCRAHRKARLKHWNDLEFFQVIFDLNGLAVTACSLQHFQ